MFSLIGCHQGSILVFYIPSETSDIELIYTKKAHNYAITDLASNRDTLVSADDSGVVILWKHITGDLRKTGIIESYGYNCITFTKIISFCSF